MKRILSTFAVALLCAAASAQQMPSVPVDSLVRIGRLDNGLTYYIRHNEEPKGQTNFYIAQKVGSILEEENQRGLAHFLEHMCFNGTEHFPGNGVIKYCEKIGVKFGADLNAYTSIDETVYNIDRVPVETFPEAVDSCLWILHDWADGLLLSDEDIDHERGVIHEEWRTRQNASMRQYEQFLPIIYPDGNRYGQRMPIGLMEVIDNFPYQALRDYYEKWYRPDLQGIVVVGDIDVDNVEARIKDIFGTIATPVNPAERFYVEVPDNREPIIVLTKDKEQPYAISYLFWKFDPVPAAAKTDRSYIIYKYAQSMATSMLNTRLGELMQIAEPPFVQAAVAYDDFFIASTKKALMGLAVTDEVGLEKGVTTLYREILRAYRGGFTASEYERARSEYLSDVESSFNKRDKKTSAEFCREYVRNFIDNEPIMGIENLYAVVQTIAPQIPVEVINRYFSGILGEGNLVVTCMLPDKEGVEYMTSEQLGASLAAVAGEEIAPYEDKVSDEPLISGELNAGKVVKKKPYALGYTSYKLSNGVTVLIKTTDFNKDEIKFTATSLGGTSLYPAAESANLKCAEDVAGIGGVGSFSKIELTKALSGKQVSLNRSISVFSESLSGTSTPKDLETFLQLVWLNFTSPRSDEEAFISYRGRISSILKNAESQPMTALQDTLYNTLYVDASRIGTLKFSQVDGLDYARMMQINRERFANAADFTFVFTGAIDTESALPLIEKYIGSLPAKGKKEKFNPNGALISTASSSNVFDRKMADPVVTNVFVDYARLKKYSLKEELIAEIGANILTEILLEEIREKEGGTYGINAVCRYTDIPVNEMLLQIIYQTSPDRYEYLNGRISDIVREFVSSLPSEERLSKAREYFLKTYKSNLRENDYWQDALVEYSRHGIDTVSGYDALIGSITAADIRDFYSKFLANASHKEVIMHGIPNE